MNSRRYELKDSELKWRTPWAITHKYGECRVQKCWRLAWMKTLVLDVFVFIRVVILFFFTGGLLSSNGHYIGFGGYIAKPIPRPSPGFSHLHHSLLACRQPYLSGDQQVHTVKVLIALLLLTDLRTGVGAVFQTQMVNWGPTVNAIKLLVPQ